MKVYNEDKTQELQEYDLTKGHLQPERMFIKHYDYVQEQGHYETIKEYENGGKDVKWVVDIAGQEEHDEYEDILVYVPYTEEELKQFQIADKKALLQKYKEDVEQVELFGMERADYEEKKRLCAEMIIELRELEGKHNAV